MGKENRWVLWCGTIDTKIWGMVAKIVYHSLHFLMSWDCNFIASWLYKWQVCWYIYATKTQNFKKKSLFRILRILPLQQGWKLVRNAWSGSGERRPNRCNISWNKKLPFGILTIMKMQPVTHTSHYLFHGSITTHQSPSYAENLRFMVLLKR